MIRVRDLAVGYGARPVLDGIDLDIADGQVTGIVGPNGSGKTTLLRALGAALAPTRGSIEVDGRSWGTFRPARSHAPWPPSSRSRPASPPSASGRWCCSAARPT